MPKRKPGPVPKFKYGAWVAYPFYPDPGRAQVIGTLGPLGGELVYRLREVYPWGEVREFYRPESDLQPSDPPEHQPVPRPPEEWDRWTG